MKFANNLIVALFQLDFLPKPILTKHYQNKTVEAGQNTTMTCETQIDSLPIFLFYKLNSAILSEYNSNKTKGNFLEKYADPLQLRDDLMADDYTSKYPRIRFERRIHTKDSNRDILADLETIHMHIMNAIESDTGYYLCIVANSLKSFRVTYGYLEVIERDQISMLGSFNSSMLFDLIQVGPNQIEIGLLTVVVLLFIFFMMLTYHCCNNCLSKQDRKDKYDRQFEKTMNSMKKNFVYVSMPEGTIGTKSSVSSSGGNGNGLRDCGTSDTNSLHSTRHLLDNKSEHVYSDGSVGKMMQGHLFTNKNASGFLEEDPDWEFPRDK